MQTLIRDARPDDIPDVEAECLYVRPECRGSGIVAALLARIRAEAGAAGAKFMHFGGDEPVRKLYDRIGIGRTSRDYHLSGKAFQRVAGLDGLPPRAIVRGLPPPELSLEAADADS